MFANTARLTVLLVLTLILLVPGPGWSQSSIYMKDGRVIKVDNFWREEGMVKYETLSGIVGISMADVEKIVTPAMVAYEEARKLDTIKGYEQFLKEYGLSDQAAPARKRLKELEFQEVRQIDTPSVYLSYIERNPSSVFLEEARNRAETLVYEDALASNEIKKYDAYLSLFPEGKYRDQVRQDIEVLQVESLKEQPSITDIDAFLTANPDSNFRGELEGLVAQLTAEAEAAARKKLEAQNRAKELKAAQAELRRKRLIQFGGIGALLTLLAAAVVAFMKISARRKAAALLLAQLDDELGDDAPELYKTWEKGPVRYEDLLGIERNPESGALPGVAETKAIDGNTQPALPEPERAASGEGDTREEDGISPFMEDGPKRHDGSVIQLGGEDDPQPADSGEEEMIDLSDHETDFKLELEDIREEGQEKDSHGPGNVGTQEFDPEDLDFSGILDGKGDETKRRRGGGQV